MDLSQLRIDDDDVEKDQSSPCNENKEKISKVLKKNRKSLINRKSGFKISIKPLKLP